MGLQCSARRAAPRERRVTNTSFLSPSPRFFRVPKSKMELDAIKVTTQNTNNKQQTNSKKAFIKQCAPSSYWHSASPAPRQMTPSFADNS
jgi:hypothetical protein